MFQCWVGAKIDPDASGEGVEVDLILGDDASGLSDAVANIRFAELR
jgi:hypothetical protein